MMRSLWTAASGMISQQQNVDTISNNIANVNTVGFKKERMEFKTLLYETLRRADLDPANQTGSPVNLQIGHGVRPVATARYFSMGNLETTSIPLNLAIEGSGFFVVERPDGTLGYTRDGTFKTSINEDNSLTIVSSEGYQLLDTDGEYITIPDGVSTASVIISDSGSIMYTNENNEPEELGVQIDLVQFANPQGLETIGQNLLRPTVASGEPVQETSGDINEISYIRQGVLERSNVQIAEEMVDLIVAQRAYELNSKVITTSDDMLQQANNLKR